MRGDPTIIPDYPIRIRFEGQKRNGSKGFVEEERPEALLTKGEPVKRLQLVSGNDPVHRFRAVVEILLDIPSYSSLVAFVLQGARERE